MVRFGEELRIRIDLPFLGGTRTVVVQRDVICWACTGTGSVKLSKLPGCCTGRPVGQFVRYRGNMALKYRGRGRQVEEEEDGCRTCAGKQVVTETKELVLLLDDLKRETCLQGQGHQSPYEEPGDLIISLPNRIASSLLWLPRTFVQ